MGRTVYEHFSFRRPRGEEYGYFAVAFFLDYDGSPKKLTAQMTRKIKLWNKDSQFITACQSYENALYMIHKWQGIMASKGITNVILVTDDSALANWIENPNKNKTYAPWMRKACEKYRAGQEKEILIDVGLGVVREYEKSHKFCKEEYVVEEQVEVIEDVKSGVNKLSLGDIGTGYKTITQIEAENKKAITPEIDGLHELKELA